MEQKEPSELNWSLTIPLVILYLVGIAGFWAPSYVPSIALLAKEGINQEWLGFCGNVLGAVMTLIAAVIAWQAVQRQIRAQRIANEDTRLRREFAARAALPLSLSALHKYATQCITLLETLHGRATFRTNIKFPQLPIQDIEAVRNALEHMSAPPAQQLATTLHFLQIQNARLSSLEDKLNTGVINQFEIEDRLIDAVDLAGLIDRSFSYARGPDFIAPKLGTDEFEAAFRLYLHNDLEDYPMAKKKLLLRQKLPNSNE